VRQRIVVAAAVLALASGAGALAAEAPLTFSLEPRSAEWCAFCWNAHALHASGRVDSGTGLVHVQVNECRFPGWHDITSAEPAADGRWDVSFAPPSSTSLVRVIWRDRRSATVRLGVRVAVTVLQDVRHAGRFEVSVGGRDFTGSGTGARS